MPTDDNRLTQTKEKRGSDLLQRGTTKHQQTHKHNPRKSAWAFSVPIGVFASNFGRSRYKPIA